MGPFPNRLLFQQPATLAVVDRPGPGDRAESADRRAAWVAGAIDILLLAALALAGCRSRLLDGPVLSAPLVDAGASCSLLVLERGGTLAAFDTATATFGGPVPWGCPSAATPVALAVDRDGLAWLLTDNLGLFRRSADGGRCDPFPLPPIELDGAQPVPAWSSITFLEEPVPLRQTFLLAIGRLAAVPLSDLGQGTGIAARLVAYERVDQRVNKVSDLPSPFAVAGSGDGALWGYHHGQAKRLDAVAPGIAVFNPEGLLPPERALAALGRTLWLFDAVDGRHAVARIDTVSSTVTQVTEDSGRAVIAAAPLPCP